MRPRQRWPLSFVGPAVMTLGALIVLVSSFLGWVRSGTVHRSSYDMLGLMERLGFAPSGIATVVIRLWPVLPFVVTSAVVAAWWDRRRLAVCAGLLGGLYAGIIGTVVAAAVPDSRQVGVSAAPFFTALGSAVLILGSLVLAAGRVPSADGPSTAAKSPSPR